MGPKAQALMGACLETIENHGAGIASGERAPHPLRIRAPVFPNSSHPWALQVVPYVMLMNIPEFPFLFWRLSIVPVLCTMCLYCVTYTHGSGELGRKGAGRALDCQLQLGHPSNGSCVTRFCRPESPLDARRMK